MKLYHAIIAAAIAIAVFRGIQLNAGAAVEAGPIESRVTSGIPKIIPASVIASASIPIPVPVPKTQGEMSGKFELKIPSEREIIVSDITRAIRRWRLEEHRTIPHEEAREYAKAIFEAYVETSFDPYLLAATGFHESRFFRDSVSSAGAVGPWQQLPRYSGVFDDSCWEGPVMLCRIYDELPPIPLSRLQESYTSARVAARHLTYLHNRYSDLDLTDSQNLRNALAHYNGGNNPVRECWTEYADVILLRAYGDPNQFN